jgi:hypothetical protein
MSEQGVVAAAFGRLGAAPIPLSEFPFARAFEDALDFGVKGPGRPVWGYHFGFAFRRDNAHFRQLSESGVVFSQAEPARDERFAWPAISGNGQAGLVDGARCARRIGALAAGFAGRPTLGSGRLGHLAAIPPRLPAHDVDAEDRGAAEPRTRGRRRRSDAEEFRGWGSAILIVSTCTATERRDGAASGPS